MRFLLAFCLLLPSVGAAERPAIVFRSSRGGGEDGLYVMTAGGGGVKRLVKNDRDVLHFAVHPRDSRVAYVCDPNDTEAFELHVLDLATGREIDVHRGIRFAPAWSRDGKRLAFMHYASKWRIRLTNPDVLIERPPQQHIGGDGAPSWFPDGKRVVFQSNRTKALELFVADTTTGKATRLTDTAHGETSPEASPDGRWIAYGRANDIWVMRADGSAPRNLTAEAGKDDAYTWAPDSRRIAFVSGRGGNTDIYIVELLTGARTRITHHAAADRSPAWSPDGTRLAFVSERDGNEEIYSVRDNGTSETRLTNDPARDRSPAWLPK